MATPKPVPSIDEQRDFWDWHWENWETRKVLNDWTERRARDTVEGEPFLRLLLVKPKGVRS